MALSEVGVALACIGVALFEVGVARATPKVYKYPPLIPLRLTSHEEVRRHEFRTFRSLGLRLDEQKLLDTEWPDFIYLVKV